MSQAKVPFNRELVAEIIAESGVDVGRGSIREVHRVVSSIEDRVRAKFVHMEFGIPGFETHTIAIDAEVQSLRDRKVSHGYGPFDGVPELKDEAARFAKLFMDIELSPECCVPTIGAMQGCFVSMMLAGRLDPARRKILFLEPGFPSNKLQLKVLGLELESVDLYDHRGEDLVSAIEEYAQRGDLAAIFWSSPNNPTWVILRESELQGIARVCNDYGVLAIEDLAYFGMDTRQNYYVPGEPPYQPTILRYTSRAISLVSSSKVFNYAGQRCALMFIHPGLMQMREPNLVAWTGTDRVGHAFVHGMLYPMMACVPQSPQYGLLAMLKAANRGEPKVFDAARQYSARAKKAKALFLENGFRLVYDNDLGEPLADGFYFTIAYPTFESGAELARELVHYGVSAVTLETSGSIRVEGLRACVSQIGDAEFETARVSSPALPRGSPALVTKGGRPAAPTFAASVPVLLALLTPVSAHAHAGLPQLVRTGFEGRAVRMLDVDGDCLDEILVGSADGVELLVRRSDGGFEGVWRSDVPPVTDLALADVNGDGRLDLVAAHRTADALSVHLAADTTFFATPVLSATERAPNAVAIGDANGDGRVDVAVPHQIAGTVGIYVGDGTGRFSPHTTLDGFTLPWDAALGDADGDGDDDLVVSDYFGDALVRFDGDGRGGFSEAFRADGPGGPLEVAFAREASSTLPDARIVSILRDAGQLITLDAELRVLDTRATGPDPQDLFLGDVDGDAMLDAVVADAVIADVRTFPGTGDGFGTPQGAPLPAPAECGVRGRGRRRRAA